MSKIITKRQLNTLIESTLKEYNSNDWMTSTGGDEDAYSSNPHHPNHDRHTPPTDLGSRPNPNKNGSDNNRNTEMTPKDIASATKHVDYMKDVMCECGGAMYEGTCNECGSTGGYMGEGKKEIKNPGKYMGKAKQKAGVDDDGDGVPNGADKDPKDGDVTEASVKDLAESVTKTFNPSFLTENMDNFNKLINYRNK
jgi:hypothetical protein